MTHAYRDYNGAIGAKKIDILMNLAEAEGFDADTAARFIQENHRRSKSWIMYQLEEFHDIYEVKPVSREYIDFILSHIGCHYTGRGIAHGVVPGTPTEWKFHQPTASNKTIFGKRSIGGLWAFIIVAAIVSVFMVM